MKKLLIPIVLAFLFSNAQAQVVSIPDTNFLKALIEQGVDTSGNGQIELNEAYITAYIDVKNSKIEDLTGIESFINLVDFNCTKNKISKLDMSKNINLKFLYCDSNVINYINITSSNLLYEINCNSNKLTSIDVSKNTFLEYLSCAGNTLNSIDISQNTILKYLDCRASQLTALDLSENIELTRLFCTDNQINDLDLSKNSALIDLNIGNNHITTLNLSLNTELYGLNCSGNLITTLDLSNKYYLYYLNCSNNLLTSLDLKDLGNLYYLSCSNNMLSSIIFPENLILQDLKCEGNKLKCLPFLSRSLENITTDLKCLPNKPSSLKSFNGNKYQIPLCNATNNQNQCKVNPIVSGIVFFDLNENGIKDINESTASNVKILLHELGIYTFSNDSGYYEMLIDSAGTFTMSSEIKSNYKSSSFLITITSSIPAINQNFALPPNTIVKDFKVTMTSYNSRSRPGFWQGFSVEMENVGTLASDASLLLDAPSNFIFSSSYGLGVGTNSWSFANVQPGQKIKGSIYGKTSVSTPLGDTLHYVTTASLPNDADLSNNTSKVNLLVTGSFDPNDKQGPATITPEQALNGDFLDYTIRFQNTGTDTAFTVVVSDTLSNNLQSSTLEMISSSNTCKTTVNGNKIYFEFLNILLPDSNTNEPESHGYVRFKVKAKSSLVKGNSISNTASIYFDYNSPVVTNTVQTVVYEPIITSISDIEYKESQLAYPNPVSSGRLYIQDSKGESLKLSNSAGETVLTTTATEQGLDVSQLPKGLYILEIAGRKQKVAIQ